MVYTRSPKVKLMTTDLLRRTDYTDLKFGYILISKEAEFMTDKQWDARHEDWPKVILSGASSDTPKTRERGEIAKSLFIGLLVVLGLAGVFYNSQ